MPCPTCKSTIIRFGGLNVCPNCEHIQLMNRQKAIKKLFLNELAVESIFNAILTKNLDKNHLLLALNWQRELFSRAFLNQYQSIDTNEFLSSNLLILRIMKEPYFNGKTIITNAEITAILEGFKALIEAKESRLLLMQGLGEPLGLYDKIHVLYNENFFPILNSYENNDIMEKSKADEKIRASLPSFFALTKTRKQATAGVYSPSVFIKKHYSVINLFYCGFLRNSIFDEVFGLLIIYKKLNVSPWDILLLVNSYPLEEDRLYNTSIPEFTSRAKRYLNLTEHQIKQYLIFNEQNSNIFPLFLSVNGRIYISHRSTFLIYFLLHAIVYKGLFDKETEERSRV
jgi:hypothetical protein